MYVYIYIYISHLCDLTRKINQIVSMRGFRKRSTTHCNAMQRTATH